MQHPDLARHLADALRRRYPRACWNCTGYDGPTPDGGYALCARPGCCRVRPMPETGCGSFQPDPGIDAETVPAIHAYALAVEAFQRERFEARQIGRAGPGAQQWHRG